MITKSEIRPGAYFDSVVLMKLQRSLIDLEGVDDAGVIMATPANLELLEDADLVTSEGKTAKPDDLLIVVRAENEKSALSAIQQVDELLKKKSGSMSHDFRPHSLQAAAKQLPKAKWVLISVPGRYAADVARDALELDKHVFLYSDNVSIEDEIELKKIGSEKGLLVMGPDCGTAIINGIGLGFANRVQKGAVGLVSASGTGLQAISTHIHNAGGGISHAIGTGGRDLKSSIGAITTIQGLELLGSDEETKVIVLISKPPAAEVAAKVFSYARNIAKPVIINFIGYPAPSRQQGNLHFVTSFSEAAELAIGLADNNIEYKARSDTHREGYVRGLFSGGTLAYAAVLGLQTYLTPLYTNVPITAEQKIDDPLKSQAHTIVDLGEDIFTVGRLHPMMDNDLRIRRMRQEAADQDTSIILLDLVLGEGSHPDPAKELSPVIQQIKTERKNIEIVVLVIGTEDDPQDIHNQIEQLEKVGATVFRNTNDMIDFIGPQFAPRIKRVDNASTIEDINAPLAAINVGVETFYDSLKAQGAEVVQVDWRPPAGGNDELMDILAKMRN